MNQMPEPSHGELNASIIVVSYNRREELRECLDTLPESVLLANNSEIIVVDDGSTDETFPVVQEQFPHVRLLRNETNTGPSAARNTAARNARGSLLLFLDSDAVPTEHWLREMIARHNGETLLIGAIQDYHGGRIQSGPRRATFIGKSIPCRPGNANTGAACNLAIPRHCFEQLGGFDEELPYYFEDSDLCIRAHQSGMKATYVREALVRHKGNEFKRGAAIRMQEHNSTYAMLKLYQNQPARILLFSVLNAAWAFSRMLYLACRWKWAGARELWRGWWTAHQRFRRRVRLQ